MRLVISKHWKRPRFVLLLYKEEEVARFELFTSEDCHGARKLSGFSDIAKMDYLSNILHEQGARLLRAIYVEYNLDAGPGSPGKLIEDFGYQWITGVNFNISKYTGCDISVFIQKF